jgi:hypothetical protein
MNGNMRLGTESKKEKLAFFVSADNHCIQTNLEKADHMRFRDGKKPTVTVVVAGVNDLATKWPHLAAQWHPTKNTLTVEQVSLWSPVNVWWICKAGHEWETRPADRIMGGGCPFCAGYKVLEGFNDFLTTHPKDAAEWHPTKNGDLTPRDVTATSDKAVWWLGQCGHAWEATPGFKSRGNVCPVSFSCY